MLQDAHQDVCHKEIKNNFTQQDTTYKRAHTFCTYYKREQFFRR